MGISIHAPHEGERPALLPGNGKGLARISIHAPHEGERLFMSLWDKIVAIISIHAPHEGERLWPRFWVWRGNRFQSTLPTRGSDRFRHSLPLSQPNFNPRSPRGGATAVPPYIMRLIEISIHAPHEGERPHWQALDKPKPSFQSTLPTRGSDA